MRRPKLRYATGDRVTRLGRRAERKQTAADRKEAKASMTSKRDDRRTNLDSSINILTDQHRERGEDVAADFLSKKADRMRERLNPRLKTETVSEEIAITEPEYTSGDRKDRDRFLNVVNRASDRGMRKQDRYDNIMNAANALKNTDATGDVDRKVLDQQANQLEKKANKILKSPTLGRSRGIAKTQGGIEPPTRTTTTQRGTYTGDIPGSIISKRAKRYLQKHDPTHPLASKRAPFGVMGRWAGGWRLASPRLQSEIERGDESTTEIRPDLDRDAIIPTPKFDFTYPTQGLSPLPNKGGKGTPKGTTKGKATEEVVEEELVDLPLTTSNRQYYEWMNNPQSQYGIRTPDKYGLTRNDPPLQPDFFTRFDEIMNKQFEEDPELWSKQYGAQFGRPNRVSPGSFNIIPQLRLSDQ